MTGMYLHTSVPFRDIFALWGYICRNAYIYRYTYFMVYISDELLWTLMYWHIKTRILHRKNTDILSYLNKQRQV